MAVTSLPGRRPDGPVMFTHGHRGKSKRNVPARSKFGKMIQDGWMSRVGLNGAEDALFKQQTHSHAARG